MIRARAWARATVLCAFSIAASAWGHPALAASGAYSARHTATGWIEGLELADGVVGARLEFDVHVRNDAGAGFLHDARGHCIGVALFEADSPASSGVCTFEDADGDVLFMRFDEDPFTSSGTAESIGGTGKYAGVRVEQTHRTMDWDQLAGARFEATGVRTGTWRLPGDGGLGRGGRTGHPE